MRNLCVWSVVVTVLFSVSSWAQQMALLDAPEPAASSSSLVTGGAGGPAGSSSLTGGAGSAVLPVMRKPAADRRAGLTQTDWTLLGAAGALRLLDYTSTVKAMSDPIHFREDQLPNALVHCRPGLGAFEASMVGVNYYAYRVLVEHRHRKLARWGQVINLAATGWTVGRNYYELHEYWPRQNPLRPGSK